MKFIKLKYFYKIHILFLYLFIHSTHVFSFSSNKFKEITHNIVSMVDLGFSKDYNISLRTDENQIGNGLWNIGIQVIKNKSYLNGFGVLILVGNEVMVLTNSHNLLGEKKLPVYLRTDYFLQFQKLKVM